MKKYSIFMVSFILFFILAEILFGTFLTATYVPDIDEAWNQRATLPQQIEMISSSKPFFSTFLLAFLSGTAVYFIIQKISKHIKDFL